MLRILHIFLLVFLLGGFSFTRLCAVPVPVEPRTTIDTLRTDSQTVAPNDSVIVSVLTVSPGSRIYELYGHTALRVHEVRPGRHSDWVFNYGTFNFEQPNFIWRFVLGETDYELGVVPYALFYDTYVREGRGITELRLNLTPDEATRLVDALSENLLPQNATYRYSFFDDNCVTRAIRIIEASVSGKVVWEENVEKKSLRDLVHEFSAPNPWDEFGQDLLLGAETDEPAGLQRQMFAPLYAERFLQQAKIVSPDGSERPLISSSLTLLPPTRLVPPARSVTPTVVFCLLFVFTLGLTVWEWRKQRFIYVFDFLLLTAQGFVGLVIAFLFFFSAHPTVDSNWLILLFNPLPLVAAPWLLKHASLRRFSWVSVMEAVLLLLFAGVGIFGNQYVAPGIWIIAASLTVRTVRGLCSKSLFSQKLAN